MGELICWAFHRAYHTVLYPGILPWPLDFNYEWWCSLCHRNGGGKHLAPSQHRAFAV